MAVLRESRTFAFETKVIARKNEGSGHNMLGFFLFVIPPKSETKLLLTGPAWRQIDGKAPKTNREMAYMSQSGYDKMVAELQRLESVERPAASAAIAEARDKGDLSENAEYDAAKEAQGKLETKIALLKKSIMEAKIIDMTHMDASTVQILASVELKNVKTGMKMKYRIVSDTEANLREGKIAVSTPIAQGLLGKKVGEVANIKVPQGTIQLEVTGISYEE